MLRQARSRPPPAVLRCSLPWPAPRHLAPLVLCCLPPGCAEPPSHRRTPTSRTINPTPSHPTHPPPPPPHFAEVCGQLCGGPTLGDHLMRMGEALGMAVVPLTPGGSVVMGQEPAAPGPDALAAAGASSEQGEGCSEAQQASRRASSSDVSEQRRYRTTSD